MIPAKFAARFINGNAFKPSEWGDKGLPILRIAQLSGNDFDNYFDGELEERYKVVDGDLLFAWSATIESYLWDRGEAWLNQHIFKVVPRSGVSKRFLYYSLKHYSKIWADIDAHGSTTRHIKKESLGNKIYIPERENQEAIADFLDRETSRIDQLLAKRSAFARLLAERQESLVADLVIGSSAHRSTWMSEVPNGWKAERAKFHYHESQRRSGTGAEELLTVSHITGVTKRSEKDVNMFMAETNEGYKLVWPGDIIVNTMWAWMGAMGVSREHGLISPSYGVYRPISNELLPEFVDVLVRSKPFVAEATRRSKGIHSSRLRLYPDAFLDMLLPIPPIGEQSSILSQLAERISKENELLKRNERADELLREFRSALVTAAVTGQIDVTAWANRGEADRRLDRIQEEMAKKEASA